MTSKCTLNSLIRRAHHAFSAPHMHVLAAFQPALGTYYMCVYVCVYGGKCVHYLMSRARCVLLLAQIRKLLFQKAIALHHQFQNQHIWALVFPRRHELECWASVVILIFPSVKLFRPCELLNISGKWSICPLNNMVLCAVVIF
jgi:hypothetical protein